MSATIIDTPEGIARFHLLQLKYGMQLAMKGIRIHPRRAVFPYVKQQYGLHGSREVVYRAFCAMHGLEE